MNQHTSDNDYSTSLIFGAMSQAHRDSLLKLGQERSYKKGQTLFSRGEEGDWILLIQQGVVEISVVALNGRKSILNLMEKNEVLGEIALLDRRQRSADAVAKTDVTGIVLQRGTVIDFLKKNTDACFSLIETLCARVRNASSMFETLALTSAGARLARCLLRLSEKWGVPAADGAVRIDHNISQTDLGEFSGLARENVNRYIKTWSGDGLLSFNKGEITLFDNARLREIAEL
ncbi:MAG: Crp/Fnr family transcriptional regulator [Thiotrichales bacterium]|nr:MAG: Crp/Fnr family transcriptional regulator [Thiotrichales bacterium]